MIRLEKYGISTTMQAYYLLIITTLCWGLNAVFARMAVGDISPMLLVSVRWLGTFILLALFTGRAIIADLPAIRRNFLICMPTQTSFRISHQTPLLQRIGTNAIARFPALWILMKQTSVLSQIRPNASRLLAASTRSLRQKSLTIPLFPARPDYHLASND